MLLELISIFFLLHVGVVFSCNTRFHVSEICNKDYGTPLEVIRDVNSLMTCSSLCGMDNNCTSVLFDNSSQTCTTNSEFATSLASGCGYQYAEFDQSGCKVIPEVVTSYGEACNTSTDCITDPDSFTECSVDICTCKAGYSFNPSRNNCVKFCDNYGAEFSKFEGYLLLGFNEDILQGTSEKSCKAACIGTSAFTCRAAEWSASDNKCYLSNETASTRPTEFVEYTGYIYYQRHCEDNFLEY